MNRGNEQCVCGGGGGGESLSYLVENLHLIDPYFWPFSLLLVPLLDPIDRPFLPVKSVCLYHLRLLK